MNDYMATYHDSVLLISKVMRQIIEKPPSELQEMEFVSTNYFRNSAFRGKEGKNESKIIIFYFHASKSLCVFLKYFCYAY